MARELASRGHQVTFWCSTFWHHKKKFFADKNTVLQVGNYELHALHAGGYRTNHSVARFLHHRKMARIFAIEARKKEVPDIIVAGLPIHDCAYEAVRFGTENKIPVIVDLRDYWPDNYLMLFPSSLRWLVRWVLAKDFRMTRYALSNATALVAMMSHLLNWAREAYACRPPLADDQVFLIGGENFDRVSLQEVERRFPELKDRTKGRFVVNYIGGFSFLTHPMVLIDAAKRLKNMGLEDQFLFVLAGTGDYHERCVRAAEGLSNTVFLGWLDVDGMAALNSVSHAGVIPSHEVVSFPNKAFSYLGAGLPIFSSERGDLHNLLKKYQAGYYFDISNPQQLADLIYELSHLDKSSYAKISANSKSLFENHLQADMIYREFANYVERIALQTISNGKSRPIEKVVAGQN